MAEIFAQPIRIEAADIDELGHVNNIIYLRWAQEIAIAHWRSRASAEMLASLIWVVTRHEVDYRAPLLLGDEAMARTWVEPAPHGALWGRHVEIVKAGAEKPSAAIFSTWCLVDAASRRVKRVPAELIARFVA